MLETSEVAMRLAAVILLALATFGCATVQPVSSPASYSRTFPVGYARTWSALVGTIAEQSLPIRAIEKESGVITTDFVMSNHPFDASTALGKLTDAGCGFCVVHKIRDYYSVVATDAGTDSTRVQVTAHIEGFTETMFSNGWSAFPSNGREEQVLLNALASKLGLPEEPIAITHAESAPVYPLQPPPAASHRDSTGKYVPAQLYGR